MDVKLNHHLVAYYKQFPKEQSFEYVSDILFPCFMFLKVVFRNTTLSTNSQNHHSTIAIP